MVVIIKCNPLRPDPRGKAIVTVKTYRNCRPQVGDRAFIWTSETAGGEGLASIGMIEAAVILSTSEAQLHIKLGTQVVVSPIRKQDLVPYRDSQSPMPISTLAKKLYKNSHNKVVDLTPDETEFLTQRLS